MKPMSTTSPTGATGTAAELRKNVMVGGKRRLGRWLWRGVALLVVAGIVVGVIAWRKNGAATATRYDTKPVTQGDLKATVSATGTLSGRDTVEIGAQVTGTIKKIYVDFNDHVTKGQTLLEIEPDQLQASRNQARAKLTSAQASYRSAKATASEAEATAKRKEELAKQGLVSDADLLAAKATAARAKASIQSSSAEIAVAKASLESAQTSLNKTVIKSPIDGIVLSRSVEEGQTVTASLQTPVLFMIARDLKQMELSVGIDEADVGRVKEGQPASFTVDAFPGREFPAKLRSLRNVPTTTDNVVTYEAVLDVSNDDETLRPGMTATVTIVTEHRENVILVPNAALRFTPPSGSSFGPRNPLQMFGGRRGGSRPSSSGAPAGSAGPPKLAKDQPRVYILASRGEGQPARPRPVAVKLGVTDGQNTEVLEGVKPGTQVIIDMLSGEE
ncbi:MAG: efflux RND transporter periplasmic adaptor subunit [Myxococcales bacterium]|nr:efflux RND transporter periplasmic adaptor subunit [Myxococcales bacterium]MCB9582371.1 efflux RND transporter periplasmic adaptor subunit [Polyangiaceae bacterium]